MMVPFVDLNAQYLSIKDSVDSAIQKVIADTTFVGGHPVRQFEQAFAELLGVKHCIGVANGTDAIYIALRMLGIGAGDEVITTATSWISTSETISQTGARPVFVDIDKDYYTIDVDLVKSKINSRTKAIIPVHLYGQAVDIGPLAKLCKTHNLVIIEDCAQSHLTETQGKYVGQFGVAGTFSFYPGKNLGAYGDAGAIVTNDSELAERVRMYANHGALKKHAHLMEGINSRLDTIQAAILLAKLPQLKLWTKARISHAAQYSALLKDVKDVRVPEIRPETVHSFHLYVIRVSRRDELKSFLEERGVQTAIHYPSALPNLPAYRYLGHSAADFPVASKHQDEILSLPMFPELTPDQINHVVKSIREFYQQN